MAEAKNFKERAYFVATGIRLHLKLYILKALGIFRKFNYCIAFPSISEGLRAEKLLKRSKLKASTIPIPNEIFEGCGVGVLVTEDRLKEVLNFFRDKGVMVSGVYRKSDSGFEEVKE